MKHTPGPWTVSGGQSPMPGVPRMWWLRYGAVSLGTDNEADARLCAAAPDMAESLRDLLDRLAKYIDRRVPDDGPDWEFSKLWKEIEKANAALAKAGL